MERGFKISLLFISRSSEKQICLNLLFEKATAKKNKKSREHFNLFLLKNIQGNLRVWNKSWLRSVYVHYEAHFWVLSSSLRRFVGAGGEGGGRCRVPPPPPFWSYTESIEALFSLSPFVINRAGVYNIYIYMYNICLCSSFHTYSDAEYLIHMNINCDCM